MMNKVNNIKKVFISIVMFCIAVLLGSTSSQAVYFSSWKAGSNPLWTSKDFYCIQHQSAFGGGEYTENVSERMVIRSDNPNQSYRALAYILKEGIETGNGGYNRRGKYQIAVWKWYLENPVNGQRLNERNPEKDGYSDYGLYSTAKNVKSIPYSNANTGITIENRTIAMSGEIGSFYINNLNGNISEFEMTWSDGTKKTLKQNDRVPGWIEFYKDKKCTQKINIKDMKSKMNVYFKNISNLELRSIKITVPTQASGYQVTVKRYHKNYSADQQLISAELVKGQSKSTVITLKMKYSYGKIHIKKIGVYNEDNKKKKDLNVSATFKLYCNTLGKWVSGGASGRKTYVDNIQKATEYKSNTIVDKLYADFQYELVEVNVNNDEYKPIKMVGVTSNLQKGGLTVNKNGDYYSAKGIRVVKDNTNIITPEDERAVGNIKIQKVDNDYNEVVLSGAEFIINKEGTKNWIILNSDGTYNYNGKFEDIGKSDDKNNKKGVYVTNANGIIEINKIKYGKYHVYEIKAPDGYNIEKQDNYDKDKKWIDLGIINLDGTDANVTYTVKNKKIVNLEGKVWIDIPDDKVTSTGDNVYSNEKDQLLEGIKVSLYNAEDKAIATTTTGKLGYYRFEDLNYWDLSGCYVEFTYDNTKYIVVDPFAGKDLKINSKAMEETMIVEELIDENLTGMKDDSKEDLPGKAITYKGGAKLTPKDILDNNESANKDLNKTPLTGYYNNSTYTIEDINLGLIEKEVPELFVGEELEYIKIAMNGYTYTYKFGDAEVTNSQFVPTVEQQKNPFDYYPKINPTDIAYNVANDTDELKVYAVYSINIKNNTTANIDDKYVEQKLYLSELNASYDSSRFELSTAEIGNENENKEFKLWSLNNNKLVFNKDATAEEGNKFANGIAPLAVETTHIQFRLKDDIVRKILTDPGSVDNSQAATQVFATGYNEYLRTDNVWNDNKDVIAFRGAKGTEGYPRNNKSNEKYYVHKSVKCSDTSSALNIIFNMGESRILSGTVFEDKATDDSIKNKQYLGNGIIDNNEKERAQNVKVELLNQNKEVSSLYQKESIENNKYRVKLDNNNELPKAITTTNKDGNYSFDGVVPGYYYIRFTYGDGTQKLVMADGKEEDLNSKDYRSTIITNDNIKKAIEEKKLEESMKIANWYKLMDSRNYSTAVDDLEQRKAINLFKYTDDGKVFKQNDEGKDEKVTAEELAKLSIINSYTPMISISIEDDKDETKQLSEKDLKQNEFTGFNLGLIKQIDSTIIVDKKITDVKFTNQAGTTLVSENPASKKSTYVSALDAIEGGSKYAKLEIEPELIYGSNIELTYEITIENQSSVDYIEDANHPNFGDYYKYGTVDERVQHKKKITVNVLEDDLDPKFNYNSLPTQTVQTTSFKTNSEPETIKIEPVITENTESNGEKTKTQYFKMTGWESLESGQSTKTSYKVTALIAKDDLDSAYNNDAKVKSLSIDTLSTLSTNTLKNWKADNTIFTITPTTGENRNYMYWYIGGIGLAVVATGIFLIKKKVL